MPGTLNVGDTIPVVLEAVLFFGFIELDPIILVALIAASVVGAVIGASIVSKWPVKIVRIALGIALIALAIILFCKTQGFGPFGAEGTITTLADLGIAKFIVGIIVNFILGALMTIGVGLYAPCMALIGALGMNIGAAFPVMMGSCAFLMPSAGITFVKNGKYDRKASIMLSIFGVVGVLVAYLIVKSMNLKVLTYIVLCVMIITSITFFHDAAKAPAKES
jgi:uncharacterized membrane protein YfcA